LRFWDASALVPLLVREEISPSLLRIFEGDAAVLVWWGTEVECASAIARLERQASLSTPAATEVFRQLSSLAQSWNQIVPAEIVRDTARRLLRTHDLRAGDALQLAAAFVAAESRPATLDFVCLDRRLGEAAQREGFSLLGREQISTMFE
jgi:predicted nucleic acid-binding protein